MPARATTPSADEPRRRPRVADPAAVAALIIANLVPLLGVLAFGWDLRAVVLTYWAENLIVAAFTLVRLLLVGGVRALGIAVFFCLHFGIFSFVHLGLLLGLTGGGIEGIASPALLWDTLPKVAVLALIASHAVSFVRHFLLPRQWERAKLQTEMMRPYPRLIVMHVAILVAARIVVMFDRPTALLVVLVLLKLGFDLLSHLHEHAGDERRFTPASSSSTSATGWT